MGVKYIAGNKDTVGLFMRPQGYAYPVGLSAGSLSVDYLVVAGGGGGGTYFCAGGGGAGGLRTGSSTLSQGSSSTVTIGGGGPGAASSPAAWSGPCREFGARFCAGRLYLRPTPHQRHLRHWCAR